MPAPSPRLNDVLRRFGANRKGSAAIQFAFVAPLFFALIFAIIEVAMVFFASQILETGTQDMARSILTNQVQKQNVTPTQQAQAAQQDLCSRVKVLLACSGVILDVRYYPAGAAFTVPPLFDASGNAITNNFTFQLPPSDSSAIVVVRAFYKWPLFVTNLGFSLANIGADKRLLTSTTAFRVEPSS
jgi:Flp pilus assembly protein TadG